MQDRLDAEYAGEHDGHCYTVQVLPSTALVPVKGHARVVLRIRFRQVTRAVMATIASRRNEALIHAAVRRRIEAGWPD